ncbi:MAG TPA: hypothetical protein VK436_01505 [Methanocella sp.]|nr:hypothetical protein [Methanocella sp.]
MNPTKLASLLRICFLVGVAVDAVACIMMLFPVVWASFYHIPEFIPSMEVSRALGTAAPLMLGWTVLLLWAVLKPVERADILLITVVPVLVGMMLSTAEQILDWGATPLSQLPTLAMQLVLSGLFLYAYAIARKTPAIASGGSGQ